MYWRLLWKSFNRNWFQKVLLVATVALGSSLATAALNISLDTGDKVGRELRSYGANIIIEPVKTGVTANAYLDEKELPKIKMIFWRNNILAFAPFLQTRVAFKDIKDIPLVGTWFEQTLDLPTGEKITTGVRSLKTWWEVDGDWPVYPEEALVGKELGKRVQIRMGDEIKVVGANSSTKALKVTGILNSGGPEDNWLLASLDLVQDLIGQQGKVERVEVGALTTPENDLARKAAADPESLTQEEFETWYCTAYVSSITYQLEEAIPGIQAKALRQVSQAEGKVLNKVQLLMSTLAILALVSAALAVSNLMQARVRERQQELGLIRALGASSGSVLVLFLGEVLVETLLGGLMGYGLGISLAWWIGKTAFGAGVAAKLAALPLVLVLSALVTLMSSFSTLGLLLRLEPARALRGS